MSQFWKPGTERPQGRVVDVEEGGVLFLSGSHHSSSSSRYGHVSIEKQRRQRLPVFKYRTAILYLVETHATTIIVGETRNGKTTQIPQVTFLQIQMQMQIHVTNNLELALCIAVPERSSTLWSLISSLCVSQAVASRVAEEMGVKLGDEFLFGLLIDVLLDFSVLPMTATRLYTEEYFLNHMSNEGIPEIQRSNMVSCLIQLNALGIDIILGFDWPASPSAEAMIRALEILYSLGVLDDDPKLTSPTGFQVAEIPLDPMVSKMIIAYSQLGCSEEIITIAALLSVQSIWISGKGIQKESDEAKLRFAAAEGDHVTFLNVYKGFISLVNLHSGVTRTMWSEKQSLLAFC
ncbi:putative pre-mRNA-splicing factor ATP-dependent RNA helicase DEAH9 [Glycine soja]|uniref:RNA helicase n=1 Tax=Glycine soja TaxID=3848 RepID=A0A445GQU0_GLYSO|nr:putative pre-mRNA-splicing factor ATP-dependent RNA helicase DEAH9 [Glycine soja]